MEIVTPSEAPKEVLNEAMIHHYLCAYVGPRGDFLQTDQRLRCPKCGRLLTLNCEDWEILSAD